MKTIEVRIPKHTLDHLEHSVHVGNHTMKALRAAGVPVEGALSLTWVSDGVLTVCTIEDDLVYTWRGEAPLVVEEEGIW